MGKAPDPLTPADCDLRGFSNLQLDVDLLPKSQLANYADAEAFRAAVLLWCEAWKTVPAASLEDSDMDLRAIVGLQRDGELWAKIKDDALRGFVKCSDGRLYHKVLAEKAIKAWETRLKYRALGKAGGKARAKALGKTQAEPGSSNSKGEGEAEGEGEEHSKKTESLNSTSPEFNILDFLRDPDFAEARKAAPGWDIYGIASDYNLWISKKKPPDKPARAFIAFCKTHTGGKPPPQYN